MLTHAIHEVSRALVHLIVDKGAQAYGTGYVVSPSGHVLTCNHLVANARSIRAHFTAGLPVCELEKVAADPAADLALLRARTAELLEPVYLHEGPFVSVGSDVAFLGFPYPDLFQPPLVMTMRGIVGNRYSIKDTEYYVIDAQAAEGFSGGPLFLARNGAVCGTISARFDPLQTRMRQAGRDPAELGVEGQRTSIAFAVTSAPARALLGAEGVDFRTRAG